jgi:ribosomal protein S18 acetylase RimI-like enzyme
MPITKATSADAAELTQLVNSAYRGASSQRGWTSEAHLLGGIRIDEPTMAEYLQNANVTMLKCTDGERQIIGCVYLEIKEQRLYLGMLTVSPTFQANGIGRQLLLEAEAVARQLNCGVIFITVITTRYELIKWYERRGYYTTGKIFPFPTDTKFGVPNRLIELEEFEKQV